MLITTDGIVLKQRKIANNRRMVVLFTRNYGKISVGTSMSEKGRTRSALALRPFTYAEYEIYKSRGYYDLNGATVKKSYYSIGEDIDRFLTAGELIGFLDRSLEEEQVRQGLFDLTVEFFDALTAAKTNFSTIFYAFIVKTLRMNGIMPELGCCVDCGKPLDEIVRESGRARTFSVSAGGILCPEHAESEKRAGGTLIFEPDFDIVKLLNFCIDNPLSVFGRIGLKPEAETGLRQILSAYLKYYMDIDLPDSNVIL